jgi:hypothetical protein
VVSNLSVTKVSTMLPSAMKPFLPKISRYY